MANLELTTPIRAGAPLSPEQAQQLSGLAASLDREQAIWVSGYFAGLSQAGALALGDGFGQEGAPSTLSGAAPAGAARTLHILYGSETGNCRTLSRDLGEAARAQGFDPRITDMADYKPRALKDEQDLLVITATHGEGDPPDTAAGFFEFLEGRKAPKLPDVRFAVLALGDSTYEIYCGAGRRVDERLAELGAQRLLDRVECDVDYEDDAVAWIASVLEELAPSEQPDADTVAGHAAAGAVQVGAALPRAAGPLASRSTSAPVVDKKHPFHAEILENQVLTGRGSSKETRHVEISLEGSGISYQPGDALGVVPRNDQELVQALLAQLELDADAPVTVRQEAMTIGEALTSLFEITAATPRFLDHWAEVTGAADLHALRGEDQRKARTQFLHEHHIIDMVTRYSAPGIDPDWFLAGLRPLQPRLYSIASSLAAAPDEAHLTVSTVRYSLHGTTRTGVASGHLATLTDADATVPVYVQANDHFHLPDEDAPLIMVGAGTGVAPYRAFMQEREAGGAGGRSWLFFGECNFRTDFLYQIEWQELLKDGVLTRLDLAFSRDQEHKIYVQHRLRERGRDVYAWLEEGASLYVCGDATHMAPDVHGALVDVVSEHGGLDSEGAEEYLAALKRDRRYLLDVY